MMESGPLQTSETGPRSRSKPRPWTADAIWVVAAWPTGIASQGTVLMAMQTPPPSWSVAAINRCRSAALTDAVSARIASGLPALWLRFTTSRPPNWRRLQSAITDSVSGPWKPTMMTAPTSSSSVIPATAGLGLAGGEVVAAVEAEGVGWGWAPPPQAARSRPARTTAAGLGIALRELPAQP